MPTFPQAPGAAALGNGNLSPSWINLPAGSSLARVYYTSSAHPQGWNELRYFGPLNARWDHHLPSDAGRSQNQERGVYYAAADARTCLAEVFQATRRIDRVYQAPWLVIFKTVAALQLLDLTGEFATRMGASMAIQSGSRPRARGWARDLYAAFPMAQGIVYASSMRAGAPALALNDRALRHPLFPPHPEFHRSLADDLLLDPLKHAAQALGYALR
jgi:RES domain